MSYFILISMALHHGCPFIPLVCFAGRIKMMSEEIASLYVVSVCSESCTAKQRGTGLLSVCHREEMVCLPSASGTGNRMNLVWDPEHHTQFCRNSGLGGQSEGCCGYSALRWADPTCSSFMEHSFAVCTSECLRTTQPCPRSQLCACRLEGLLHSLSRTSPTGRSQFLPHPPMNVALCHTECSCPGVS